MSSSVWVARVSGRESVVCVCDSGDADDGVVVVVVLMMMMMLDSDRKGR